MTTPTTPRIDTMNVQDQAIADDEILTHPAAHVVELNGIDLILVRLITPKAANTLEGTAVMEFADDTEFATITLEIPIDIVVGATLEIVKRMVDADPANDVEYYMVNWDVVPEGHRYMRMRVRNKAGAAATYSLDAAGQRSG